MCKLPRLEWNTWVRLALIPAGKDWRALDELASDPDWPDAYRIVPCESPHEDIPVPDPRLRERDTRHPNIYRVCKWDAPSQCVTGTRFGSGAPAIADPRLGHKPRGGVYKVVKWDSPCGAVVGSARVNASNGSAAVADPRNTVSVAAHDAPPIIIALDGTWHRPLTTLELAALQGFPVTLPDGSPLSLAGNSSARWRERIGNAVPPPAAKAIAEQILSALLVSARGEWVLGSTPVWVRPYAWRPSIATCTVQ